MLKTTPNAPCVPHPAGLHVLPDLLTVPVNTSAKGASPSATLEQIERLEQALGTAAPVAELKPLGYRSWTEKLAGKGLRGRGVRYCASATYRLEVPLPPDQSTLSRRRALEALRTALIPLDDGEQLCVGTARWGLRDPEAHREAWVRQLQARAETVQGTFRGTVQLDGSIQELEVESLGPRHAYVRFPATLRIHGDTSPTAPR